MNPCNCAIKVMCNTGFCFVIRELDENEDFPCDICGRYAEFACIKLLTDSAGHEHVNYCLLCRQGITVEFFNTLNP